MRERLAIVAGVVVIVLIGLLALFFAIGPGLTPSGTGTKLGQQDYASIERGRYLVVAADCEGCHTVPGSRDTFAGGRPVETPFGVVVSANITPDRQTGIGTWSDAEFDAAMRRGRTPHGNYLYPAMPYPYYTKMTRNDVMAIRAYLNTIRPIHNAVTSNELPFPFSIRRLMWGWNLLYFSKGAFKPDKTKSAAWNRGAFLVGGPGHCGACHTAKTWFGGDETSRALRGARLQGWFAPDITGNAIRGLGTWSAGDIVKYLKTGHNRISAGAGTMAETIRFSTSKMSTQDLRDIAVYLLSLNHKVGKRTPLPLSDPRMAAGQAIYVDSCSACHARSGTGSANLFPSLAASSNVRSVDPTNLIKIVLHGVRSVATDGEPTAPAMPAYGWQLSNKQTADVLTYIRNRWGNAARPVRSSEVRALRK